MRFQKTAQYASENNFDIISSTLGISRWKDMKQINDSGARSSEPHEFHIGISIGENKAALQECLNYPKKENFYQQEYCGCVYSLRDTNNWRILKRQR